MVYYKYKSVFKSIFYIIIMTITGSAARGHALIMKVYAIVLSSEPQRAWSGLAGKHIVEVIDLVFVVLSHLCWG